MKYIKYLFLVVITTISLLPIKILAYEKVTVYLFHGATCPHCQSAIEYLEDIRSDYSDIDIITYEVWEDNNNSELFEQVKEELETDSRGVPFFVIGNRYLTGFSETRKEDIKNAINYYLNNNNEYKDVVASVINGKTNNKKDNNYTSVDISKVEDKKVYKEIYYLGIVAIILIGIYIGITMYEKKK